MKRFYSLQLALTLALVATLAAGTWAFAQTDPLPSWNEGPAKKAIIEFVQATTTQNSPKFVPLEGLEAHLRVRAVALESRDKTTATGGQNHDAEQAP